MKESKYKAGDKVWVLRYVPKDRFRIYRGKVVCFYPIAGKYSIRFNRWFPIKTTSLGYTKYCKGVNCDKSRVFGTIREAQLKRKEVIAEEHLYAHVLYKAWWIEYIALHLRSVVDRGVEMWRVKRIMI